MSSQTFISLLSVFQKPLEGIIPMLAATIHIEMPGRTQTREHKYTAQVPSGMCAGSALDLRALSIVSGRSCWVLCMDALVLACDGSLLDALSIAVRVSCLPSLSFLSCAILAPQASLFVPRCASVTRAFEDVQAALQDTRIPLVEVGATEDPSEEPELELDDDPANAKHVDVSRVPVIVTVCQASPCHLRSAPTSCIER